MGNEKTCNLVEHFSKSQTCLTGGGRGQEIVKVTRSPTLRPEAEICTKFHSNAFTSGCISVDQSGGLTGIIIPQQSPYLGKFGLLFWQLKPGLKSGNNRSIDKN